MSLVFEKMAQALSANQQIKHSIAGNFLRIAEAQYPVTIEILSGNRVVGSMTNMQAGDYVRDFEFDGYVLTNGAAAQNVTLQICGGGVGSDRVMGEVSVINGELSRVKANSCFCGMGSSAGVAGQYSHVQIWNPAASGKNLILNKISALFVTNSGAGINVSSAPLTNLTGKGVSKYLGGVASVGEIRNQTNAAALGTQVLNFGIEVSGGSKDFPFSEPFVIPPGRGVIVQCGGVNISIYGSFQWNEEAI